MRHICIQSFMIFVRLKFVWRLKSPALRQRCVHGVHCQVLGSGETNIGESLAVLASIICGAHSRLFSTVVCQFPS